MTVLVWLAAVPAVLFVLHHLIRYLNRANILFYSSAVRRCSQADDRLFRDVVNEPGGVRFVDQLSFPDSKRRRITAIRVVKPYQHGHDWLERWTVQHEAGSCAYLVTFLPDGAGGTTFSVEREARAGAKQRAPADGLAAVSRWQARG